jgi:hypothetical protein
VAGKGTQRALEELDVCNRQRRVLRLDVLGQDVFRVALSFDGF